jgi:putative Mn2+ efflux pump MntP
MGNLTHSKIMRHNSWHARWYRYWLSQGGKPAPYKENLCHYWRVLLMWAPLKWLTSERIRGIAPWLIPAVPITLGFIGFSVYRWPNGWLTGLLCTAMVIGFIAACVGVMVLNSEVSDQTKENMVKWGTVPIWGVPYLLVLGMMWVYEKFEPEFKAAGRFVERYLFFGFNPIVTVVLLAFAAFVSFEFYSQPLTAGLWTIGIAAFIVAAFGLLIGWQASRYLRERLGRRLSARLSGIAEGALDTVKLVYTVIDSKKKGSPICPFIEFEEPRVEAPA